jgi:PAS domain S-box-containing protein
MKEQSKLAERILDQVADAVICANHSGTIIRWNHASTALFGYSAEEALGQSVELIIPESSASSTLERLRRCDDKGRHEASGPPDTHPRSTQERTQAVRRDVLCDC